MIYLEDILFPLRSYRDQFREKNAEETKAALEELIKQSGISPEENKALCSEIAALEKRTGKCKKKYGKRRSFRNFLSFLSVLGSILPVILLVHRFAPESRNQSDEFLQSVLEIVEMAGEAVKRLPVCSSYVSAGIFFVGLASVFFVLNPSIRALKKKIDDLGREHDELVAKTWEQMKPLNDLFDWGTVTRIIHRTTPQITLDTFFSREKLSDLRNVYGWNDEFNRNKSIIFCHSGDLKGNPFVLGESLDCGMGLKTYTGSVTITWDEEEEYTDSSGYTRTRTVTHHQELVGTIEKPCPTYRTEKFLIFGNEAAPHLSFFRSPSELSSIKDEKHYRKHLKKRLAVLEKKAQDKTNYTLMKNLEFEALFGADDRDHEIEFRLLFSDVAQTAMLELLKDKDQDSRTPAVGYGDDFSFRKSGKIKFITAEHLRDRDITASPERFRHYDLEHIREVFMEYNTDFFKAFYFALAPILAIPIYQQTPPPRFGTVYGKKPGSVSFWECETLANSIGERAFAHPESITRNILKTSSQVNDSGDTIVSVTAYGYCGVDRTDFVPVQGDDGNWHDVPVPWIEYLPVQNSSSIVLRETNEASLSDFRSRKLGTDEWRKFFERWGKDPTDAFYRRGLVYWKK